MLVHTLIGEPGAENACLLGIEQQYFGRPRPCVYAGANHALCFARTNSSSASTRPVMRAESDGE